MHSSLGFVAAVLAATTASVRAANDWSVPCHQGRCSYDIQGTANNAAVSLQIWGHEHSISDLTEAGGYAMVHCDPHAEDHDIHLVCHDSDTTSVGCDHIHQRGAIGTVVRLPDDCGAGPFAVITAWSTAEDQSLPPKLAKRLIKRDGMPPPEVQRARLSTDFSQVNHNNLGEVSFSVVASTSGNPDILSIPASTKRKRGMRRRGLFDKIGQIANDVGSAVKSVAGDAASVATKAADVVTSVAVVAESKATSAAVVAATKITSAAVAVATKVEEATTFDKNERSTPPPVDINTQFNVFNSSLDCGDKGTLKLNVDATMIAHSNVTFGLVTAGTIVPPKFDTFSFTGGLSSEFNGTLRWVGGGSADNIDTGAISFFQLGIPGLTIPGLLAVGPTLQIKARMVMNLNDTDVDMTTNLAYKISNAAFSIPPTKDAPAGGDTQPGDTPLRLAVSPNSKPINGSLAIHLIPSLNFGIAAVLGKVNFGVFVDFDTSMTFGLSPNGNIVSSTPTTSSSVSTSSSSVISSSSSVSASSSTSPPAPTSTATSAPASSSSSIASSDTASTSSASSTSAASSSATPAAAASSSAPSATANVNAAVPSGTIIFADLNPFLAQPAPSLVPRDDSTAAPTSFQGCVNISSSMVASAGATAAFFDFLDKTTRVELFTKNFKVFEKCFDGTAPGPALAAPSSSSVSASASASATSTASLASASSSSLSNASTTSTSSAAAPSSSTPPAPARLVRRFALQCPSVAIKSAEALLDEQIAAGAFGPH